MTLEEKQQEIISDFEIYDDWMDKYEYLIELGKDLPLISNELKTKDRLIEGCQSQVWLDSEFNGETMRFKADSDAIITKGIIGLLIRVLDDEKPEDIVKSDMHFINEIGFHEHLSPTRSNGLVSMVKKIKMNALLQIK
jgi:cysteine desulfuration protein SufE